MSEGKTITMRADDKTVISNFIIQTKELSLAAKGMLVLLLSDPDIQVGDLHNFCKENPEEILEAIHELENKNFLEVD